MRIATDIGGTFTDLVYLDENGDIRLEKDHTTPHNYEEGILNVMNKAQLNKSAVEMFIHGSTIVINTLTEKKGVKVGLITTKGTKDVLEIARGNRPDLYNFNYQKPKPFVERHLRMEVTERMNYKGEVLQALNIEELDKVLAYFMMEEVRAVAITFLHSYKNPAHEQQVQKYIEENYPDITVTASYQISREWREYERTNTTVLSSYVKPIVEKYLNKLSDKLNEEDINCPKFIMQSNGGSTTFNHAKEDPIQMIESGPVAGVFGAQVLGERINEPNIIAFDVGGTTAKCSLIHNGEVRITTDYFIEKSEIYSGYPIKAPVVDIVEIGNGGGSIAWIDEVGSLQVGPQSAGSNPGPIAYGLGGENATTTDAHLITGRLAPENFDYEVNMQNIKNIVNEKIAKPFNVSSEEAALGIIQIANSNMLNALRLISVRKGFDPSEFCLVAYGGGGAMHAAHLGRELKVKKIIIPNSSAVFSAWGMLQTDLRKDIIRTSLDNFNHLSLKSLNEKWSEVERVAIDNFLEEEVDEKDIEFSRYLDLRYVGQEHTVKVSIPNEVLDESYRLNILEDFHKLHEQNYKFSLAETEVEVVNIHLTSFGKVPKIKQTELPLEEVKQEAIKSVRSVYFEDNGWIKSEIYDRALLVRNQKISGPAIVEEKQSSTLLYPGQTLEIDQFGNLIIETEELAWKKK